MERPPLGAAFLIGPSLSHWSRGGIGPTIVKASADRGATTMPDTLTTNSPIIAAYRAATPGSSAPSEKASRLFPSGVTHDSRYLKPYALYITRPHQPTTTTAQPLPPSHTFI